MAQLDVCVVGEINPDLILYGVPRDLQPEQEALASGFRLTLGSSSAIFAHNLSVLGSRVGMISKIGSDALGQMALAWLSSGGVDVTHVLHGSDATPTGLTVILARADGRLILTYPGTMFELRYEHLDLRYVLSARHLHVSSYFLQKALRPRMADLFREARSKGLTTSLDTNDDPEDAWSEELNDLLPFVDLFFPNEREAKKITRRSDLADALEHLSARVGIVALKLGPQGAVARKGKEEWRCKPLAVDAIDTVGAGDSFDAGFLHRYLRGAGVAECLAFANVAGAYSTTREGGTEAFRQPDALIQFFKKYERREFPQL